MRWIVSLVLVCSFARPARADLASSLYGDVRDVIEELIQTEVTGSVVTTVGDRSPAIAFYMHGTPWPEINGRGTVKYRDVTPLSWGKRFHAKVFVSEPAMRLIIERGGHE